MDFGDIETRGLVLLGCGRMGSALLKGWIGQGLDPEAVHVVEPAPSDWLQAAGVHLNGPLPEAPAVLMLAVKPQVMEEALAGLGGLGGGRTLVLSIAAGTSIRSLEQVFGPATPIVRSMPNTPAAVGRGITALVPNEPATEDGGLKLATALMSAVGEVTYLEAEDQIDAVTAVSGSGPAYVFLLIEALAEAGAAEGLAPEVAMKLARETVAGAAIMAATSDVGPGELRGNVTSPAGTTAAALKVLMDEESGLRPLLREAVRAAAARSLELG
ncbi:MAG: pyrroline-5-carboxylate reductase [Paracoccaceae bacterium]|nr:pyrroline-5-carboxylate reductase [Paracoccaceae bacterium]